MSDVEAVETLVCEANHSGFNSRQTPSMEVAANWMASGLENRSTAGDVVGGGHVTVALLRCLRCPFRSLQLPPGNVAQLGRATGF